jgi:hypothetical protein
MEKTGMQGTIARGSILVILLIAAFTIKPLVLGGGQKVVLQDAPALSGQISQAFAITTKGTLPVVNKDYKIQTPVYFDNNEWAVVPLTWLTSGGNDTLLVLQKRDGIYTTVLGPGSAFPDTVTESLPNDVSLYLKRIGALI